MQTPFYVRPLLADERATLETGLRSASAFTVRRCQSLLASAEGQVTTTIAHDLRCTEQTVRNALHAFHQRGLTALQPQSSRPHTTATIFDAGTCEALRALLHQSPRTFGKPTSRWTLQLAAEVSVAQGLTPRLVSDEAIRVALPPLGGRLEARQALDHQSRSGLSPKKKRRDQVIQRAMARPTWALGFGDEGWWSRLAQPNQHCWTDTDTTYKLQELTPPTDDPDPKALACYGLLVRPGPQQAGPDVAPVWRWAARERCHDRFPGVVRRAPRGARLHRFAVDLGQCLVAPQPGGAAPGYASTISRSSGGATGGRIVVCPLPSKSPWLNPIEPQWVHGKRAVSEPDRLLSADELGSAGLGLLGL